MNELSSQKQPKQTIKEQHGEERAHSIPNFKSGVSRSRVEPLNATFPHSVAIGVWLPPAFLSVCQSCVVCGSEGSPEPLTANDTFFYKSSAPKDIHD